MGEMGTRQDKMIEMIKLDIKGADDDDYADYYE